VKKRNKIAKRFFSVILFSSWISFMAVAGFFVPSFLTQFPMFKVKRVVIEGNDKIPFESVKSVIRELSTNLLKLNGEELKESLNAKFGGRVKAVLLSKDLSVEGITLKVKLVERRPVAKIRIGKEFLLVDKDGNLFYPLNDDLSKLVELRTYDLRVVRNHFSKLQESVLSTTLPIKLVEIKRDRVLLYLRDKKVVLPPIELLSENVSSRLKLIYNFPEGNVDLRYRRFILVRN